MDIDVALSDIAYALAMGASVGCFIILLIITVDVFIMGPGKFTLEGTQIISAFFGTMVAGWAFSFSSFIYETEWPLYAQVLFQFMVGTSVLFVIALIVGWIPSLNLGIALTFLTHSIAGFTIFWGGFYIYNRLMAKQLTDELNRHIGDMNKRLGEKK